MAHLSPREVPLRYSLPLLLAALAAGCAGDDPYADNTHAWDPAPLLDERTAIGCAASQNDRNLLLVIEDPVEHARLVVELDTHVSPGQALEMTVEVGQDASAHVDLGPGWPALCEASGEPPSGPIGESFVGLYGIVHIDLRPDLVDFTTLTGSADLSGMEFDGPAEEDAFVIEEINLEQVQVDAG